jgi:uncharacterized lipoprotein YajG
MKKLLLGLLSASILIGCGRQNINQGFAPMQDVSVQSTSVENSDVPVAISEYDLNKMFPKPVKGMEMNYQITSSNSKSVSQPIPVTANVSILDVQAYKVTAIVNGVKIIKAPGEFWATVAHVLFDFRIKKPVQNVSVCAATPNGPSCEYNRTVPAGTFKARTFFSTNSADQLVYPGMNLKMDESVASFYVSKEAGIIKYDSRRSSTLNGEPADFVQHFELKSFKK